jgi:hypothetical protein
MDEYVARSIARELWAECGLSRASVVTDLGCDTGEILAQLRLLGLEAMVGIEDQDSARRRDLRARGWKIPEQQVQLVDLRAPLPEVFQRSAHLAIALNVGERAGPDPKVYLDNAAMLADVLAFNWLPDRASTEDELAFPDVLWIPELQSRGMLLMPEASSRMRADLVDQGLTWYQIPWLFHRS